MVSPNAASTFFKDEKGTKKSFPRMLWPNGFPENSLASLQEIRKILVDAQVNLSELHEGGLYLLVELMVEGIRQFVTFEEKLRTDPNKKRKR